MRAPTPKRRSNAAASVALAEDEATADTACEKLPREPAPFPPEHQAAPEFLDHAGLARQLSCSITTIHKLRRDKVLGEPCQIGSLIRWHWPTVRERILKGGTTGKSLDDDPFLINLYASQ